LPGEVWGKKALRSDYLVSHTGRQRDVQL